MLTCRVNVGGAPVDHAARAVARAIEQHPLAGQLTATITIGLHGASPWRPDDRAPRVAVIPGIGNLSRVQQARVSVADGVVVVDRSVARAVHAAAPGALIAIAEGDQRPFLCGASRPEAAAAWDEVARHPELARVFTAPGDADIAGKIAEHAVELVIALGN